MRKTGCPITPRMRSMASSEVVLVLLMLVLSIKGAVVTVDFRTTLVTNGEQVFDRHRFVNAHGNLASPTNARAMMEYLAMDLDVRFTRSSNEGPFSGSQGFPDGVDGLEEEGALRLNQIKCANCDPLRKRMIDEERVATDRADQLLRFQHSDQLISDAAAFSGEYFSRFFNAEEGFPKPRYSECFNEPMGEYRMFKRYPEESEYSVVSRIGNICGQMCRDIKAANPDMLAGGPGANSGRPHLQNFSRWQTRMKNFIDSARSAGCVDFISQHPYSSGGAVQDANLDLLETYTVKTSDDGKPIKYMITETGAYHGSWHSKDTRESLPPTGGRDFIIMADAFKAFMSTIRVHDNVLKFINFLTLDPTDSRNGLTHPYPWSLTDGGKDDVLEWTELLHYLELFKGVEGDFVYSYSDDPYVKVLSVANSNRAYVLLQNLATESDAAQVDLNLPFGSGVVESVVERKLWLEEGEPTADDIAQSIARAGTVRWSNSTLSSLPESVQIEPEAMHVLAVTFTTPVRELRKVERSRHYMGEILDSTGQTREYPVPVDANETYTFQFSGVPQSPNGVGYIRISHSRRLSDDAKPKVWVNDAAEPIADYDERMAGPKRNYDARYFGTFVVPYRLEDLGSSPEIKVQYSDDGGWLSSVVLEVDECVGGACCLLGGGVNEGLPCGTLTNPEDYPYRSPPNAEQLLKDPSFEEQDGAWSLLDGAEFQSSAQAFTGANRLRLGQEGAKAVQRVYLRENNVYRLHCYVRGSIRFSILDDSAIFGDSLRNTFPGPDNRWKNQEFDFLIRSSGEYDIVIERDNGGTRGLQSAGVRADECSLYAAGNVPPFVGSASVNYPPEPIPAWDPPAELLGDDGVIRNPSFEFSTADFRWSVTGPLQLTGQNNLEGTRAMVVFPGTVLNQTVFLDLEDTYRLRCYVNGPGSLTMEVSFQGDRVSKNAFGPVTPIGYGSWGYKDVVFVAPKIAMDVFLYNDGDSECIVDFCTMFKYSGPITDPENEQLVQNPSFEQGTEPWLFSNGASIRGFRTFTGVRGLRLAQEGSTAVQRVYLDGGNIYRWHCYSTGNIHFTLWKDSILYAENFGDTFPEPNSEWNNQEVDVMIEESGEYELTFVRDNGGVPSRQRNGVWTDDCSLYAAADGIPPYVGSGDYNLPDLSPWDPPVELLGDNGEIKNPSFEYQYDFRWTVSGDLKFTVVDSLIGERSMFVYPNTVATQLVYLDQNERYRLRCYVRGPGSLTMEVSHQGERISKNSFGAVTPIERGDWGYKDVIFDATKVAQDISLYNIGDSECVVDFCTLFRFSGPLTDPEYDSLLTDPSFEEDAGVWALSDGAEMVTSESFSGTQALSLTQEGSKAVQLVSLRRNKAYRLHCYVKGGIRLSIWSDSTMYAQNLGDTFNVNNSDWENQEVDFEIFLSADYEIVLERDDGGEPGAQSGDVWVDDCSLYLATDGVPPDVGSGAYNLPTDLSTWNPPAVLLESGQGLGNPSFEPQGNFRWTVSGDLKFTAIDSLLNQRSMFVYPNTVATQLVYLDQNERYRLRCYVRGPGSLTMEVSHQGERISKNSFGAVTPIERGDWGYKDVIFDATKVAQDISLYNIGDSECVVDFCTLFRFSGPLTDPEYDSLLTDPSFEEDAGVWALSDGAEMVTSESFSGTQALSLTQEGSKAVQLVSLRRNKAYRLHCYVKGGIRLSIWSDSTIYADNLRDTFNVNNSDWKNQEVDFEILLSADYEIVLERDDGGEPGAQSGDVWVDDCSLYLATDGVTPYVGSSAYNLPTDLSTWNPPAVLLESGQGLGNPSFEPQGNFRWTVSGDLKFTAIDSLLNQRSMFVYPNTVATQSLYLAQKVRYRLRCYVRGPGSLTMEVSHQGERISKNSFGAVTPIGRGDWGYKDVIYDATKLAQDISLYNIGDSECVVDFCTLFPYSGPLTDPEYDSLLRDPSFEEDAAVWALSDGAELATSVSFSVTQALSLTRDGSKAVQLVSLSRNQVYRLHCYVKGGIRLSIWRDSTMYAENLGDTFDVDNSDWKSQEVDFEILFSADYEIVLERDDGGDPAAQSGGVWVDDCSLYLATDGVPPYVGSGAYNLPADLPTWDPPAVLLESGQELRNPSFEPQGNFRWTVNGDLKFTVVDSLRGERSMFVYPNTVATQLVYLDQNERYRLRCYVRGPGSLTMEVNYQGERISKNSFGAVTIIGRGNWGYKDVIFDATKAALNISLYNIGDGECVVDFCTLFPFSGAQTDPEYDSLLTDPSFEENAGVWAFSDGAETARSENFSGTQALSLTQEGSKAVQLVSLSRNQVYRLHCYVKGSIRLSIWRDSTMYAENLGDTSDVDNSDWKNQEVDVEILLSADYEIVLERDDGGDPAAQSGGVWVDDCSLYLATDGVPPYVGSGAYNLATDFPTWDPPAVLLEPGQELKNPSFEPQRNFRWTVSGSLEFSAVQPLRNVRAMYLYPAETVARQTVWLSRDERYRMRCYVRGSGPLTMEILYQNNRLCKNSFGPVTPIPYGDWGYKEMVFDAAGITNEVLLYNVGNSECLVDFCTLLQFSGALTDPELS